jgi:ketosteroid isomerase-like protein
MSSTASQRGGLELLLDWVDALRKGDLEAVHELLAADVVWYGLSADLVCAGRAAVLDVLREQVPVRSDADALELLRAPKHLVLGTRSDHLPQPPGIDLRGQIYSVFEPRDGAFATIRDFVRRADALNAAGLTGWAVWV